MESNDPHPTKILMAEIDAMLAEQNDQTTATLWLTRDWAGVNLWRHKPLYCPINGVHHSGGETLTLSPAMFPQLPPGGCVKVTIAIEEPAK